MLVIDLMGVVVCVLSILVRIKSYILEDIMLVLKDILMMSSFTMLVSVICTKGICTYNLVRLLWYTVQYFVAVTNFL